MIVSADGAYFQSRQSPQSRDALSPSPAVPGERPVIVSARNASAESVELTWLPPASLEAMNGEFLGYRLTYRAATSDRDQWDEADLHGTDVTVRPAPAGRGRGGGREGRRGGRGR